MRRAVTLLAVLVLSPLSCGCGYGGPGPADRVAVADIVGRWTGLGCIEGAERREIELVLRADRAYFFRWLDDRADGTPSSGTWGLVGSSIVLTGREWEGYASVYPVDGQTPSGFLLFGGVKDCSDPDLYMVLRWSPIAPSDKR